MIDDRNFLEELSVDVHGNLMSEAKRESFPDTVILEKRKITSDKRQKCSSKTRSTIDLERNILMEGSMFNLERNMR